ncbi:ATP-binding cassette domain-containing protein [Streptomyces sp. NPDC005791]|uniref:ATP-binding cassette domain-containing protein n=1 Tax=Streptomyces sp. NPDC005791 TaxID=3364732 RepID=UPI003694BFFB
MSPTATPTAAARHSTRCHSHRPVTAVVGENRSGKSTLMKVLPSLLPPRSGTMRWGAPPTSPARERAQVFERGE